MLIRLILLILIEGCLHVLKANLVAYNQLQIIELLFVNDPWNSYCLPQKFSFRRYFDEFLIGKCDAVNRTALLLDDGTGSMLKFKMTPKSGIATYANRRIKRGELVLRERPLFHFFKQSKATTDDYLDQLSLFERDIFFSLADSTLKTPGQVKSFAGILMTNHFDTMDSSGMFVKMSRINHSCRPNVSYWWDELNKVMNVYAMEDIEEDQEIFDTYIYLISDTQSRKQSLRDGFHFDCNCPLCSRNNNKEVSMSDERRLKIDKLRVDIERNQGNKPYMILKKLDQLLDLYRREDLMYYAPYPAMACLIYLETLIGLPSMHQDSKLISKYARYVIGNFTISYGNEFVGKYLSTVKQYL